MQIDYKLLGEKLSAAGLTGKPVNEYVREEIKTLISSCVESLIPEREGPFTEKPSIENGRLHIPFSCNPRYWWWHPCGQSITTTLTELNASAEVWQKYVD